MRAFPFGESLVVVSPHGDSLLILNSTARLIWEHLAEGRGEECVAGEISLHFGIPPETARRDVESVLQVSREQGVLSSGTGAETPGNQTIQQDAPPRKQDRQPAVQRAYRLSNVPFRIRFHSAEIAAVFRLVLGHVEIPPLSPAKNSFEVATEGTFYILRKDGIEIGRETCPHSLRHSLLFEISRISYPHMDWLIFMHAGAIADGQRCIVFPGLTGCGKSTLVAALIHTGFRYVAEDIVPVSLGLSVAPMPVRLCIREGGWRALRQEFPDIQSLSGSHGLKHDSRYITPPRTDGLPPHLPVHCLVFPEYAPGRTLEISPIPGEEVLARLIRTGAWFDETMDASRVEGLLRWIQDTPAYQLTYPTLRDAIPAVRELLS